MRISKYSLTEICGADLLHVYLICLVFHLILSMPAPYLEQIRRAKEWQDAKVTSTITPTLKKICIKTVSRHMDVLDKKALGKCLIFDATKGVFFTLCWTKDDLGCIKAKCYSAILANACTIHEWTGTQTSS